MWKRHRHTITEKREKIQWGLLLIESQLKRKISTMSSFERVELSQKSWDFCCATRSTHTQHYAKKSKTKQKRRAINQRQCKIERIIAHAFGNAPIPGFIAVWFYVASKPFVIFQHDCSFWSLFCTRKTNVLYVILINVISWLDWIGLLRYPIIIRVVKQCISMWRAHTIYATVFIWCALYTLQSANPFTTSIRYMDSGSAVPMDAP